MTTLLRRFLKFLESARLALTLLLFVAAWSMLATIVPQTGSPGSQIGMRIASQPLVWSVVRLVGLDRAFTAPLFLAALLVLAISTALCAWRRTKVAMRRASSLRETAKRGSESIVELHDVEIACGAVLDADSALSTASGVLDRLGVKTTRQGDVLRAVSPGWTVWGSPVFHWGLLAIMVVVLLGSLQRSQGLMGVPVGRALPDTAASYGILHAGPLHSWGGDRRAIRVDSFDTAYRAGGIDRGPTPSVSVLSADGRVLKSQHIYPNSPLQIGSLTIHPAEWGFAVDMSLLDPGGKAVSTATRLVDTSDETSDGTVPVGALTLGGAGGKAQGQIITTVPLNHANGHSVVPANLTAHLVVLGPDGSKMLDSTLAPGEVLALPSGLGLRVDNVGFYSRLSVVDDGTIPLLYAAMGLALLGLTMTVVSRQQAVLVTAHHEDGVLKVFVSTHLWRNASTTREEIRSELASVLEQDCEEIA